MNKNNVKTLADLVSESASCYSDKVFIKEKEGSSIKETSYNEFLDNCKRISAFELEKKDGKRIHAAIIGATSSHYLTAYFGTVSADNIIVPLDAKLSCEDLCDHLRRSDSEILFFDKRYISMLPDIKSEYRLLMAFYAENNFYKGE